MKLLSIDSPLMRFFSKVADIMLINLLFILFSLPIVTVGASLTAMYSCFLSTGENESITIKRFWTSFKSNLRKSTVIFLCTLPIYALVVYEALVYLTGMPEHNVLNAVMYCFPFILITFLSSFTYPLQAKFENTVRNTIKNSVILAITHCPAAVIITSANLIFPIMLLLCTNLFIKTAIIWIFLGFAAISCMNSFFISRIFSLYITKDIEK